MLGSLSGWDWLDITGVLMVLVGVVGAWLTRLAKPPTSGHESVVRNRLESGFESVLVLGLAIELAAVPHHISEGGKLKRAASEADRSAAQANESAETAKRERAVVEIQVEQFRQTNLTLQATVLELEHRLAVVSQNQQWRTISNLNMVVAGLKSLPKWDVVILTVNPDAETENYFWSIVNIFAEAHYPIRLRETMSGSNVRPLVEGLGIVGNPTNLPPRDALMTLFHTSGIPVWPGYSETLTNLEIHVGKKPILMK